VIPRVLSQAGAKLSTGLELIAPILSPFDLGRITVERQGRAVRPFDLVHAVFGQGVAGDSLAQVSGELAVGLGRSAPGVQVPKGEYPPGLPAHMATGEAIQEPSTYAGKAVSIGDKSLSKGQAKGAGVDPSGNGNADSVTVNATRNKRSVWTVSTRPYPEAHYAVYPPQLIEPCILAGTSARGQCPECGAPWHRVVERTASTAQRIGGDANWVKQKQEKTGQELRAGGFYDNYSVTTGWQPSCTCDAGEPVPQVVLDPFAGSGTTLQVAVKHGRHGIGIDLDARNAELIQGRLDRVQMAFAF